MSRVKENSELIKVIADQVNDLHKHPESIFNDVLLNSNLSTITALLNSNLSTITALLGDISQSLAIIADGTTEGRNNEKNI